MSFSTELIVPAASSVCGVALGFLVARARVRQATSEFVAAAKAVIHGKPPQSTPRISDRQLAHVWQLLRSFAQADESGSEEIPKAVEIGRALAESAGELHKISQTVGRLIVQQTASAVCAVAVVIRADPDAGPKLEFCSGIPARRIESTLLSMFDSLTEGESDIRWGSALCRKGSIYDFSIFGIGAMLTVPISTAQGLKGMVWLGLPARAPALNEEHLSFLQRLCDYCCCAFETAGKIEKELSDREAQRAALVGLSHDLRAPGQSAVYALRDLLEEEAALSSEQRARLRIIEQCIEDQLTMLADVLDYSKNACGLLKASLHPVALAGLVGELLPWLENFAERQHLTIELEILPEHVVFADPVHVKRVLTNLLSNALKYTERGTIRIDSRVEEDDIALRICDTGSGVPQSEEHLLFQEFSRLSTAEGKPGTGLGLVIARRLAELNKGTLEFHRSNDWGSVFELRLPRTASNLLPQSLSSSHGAIQSALVIEDDEAARRMNAKYLRGLACQVRTAASCREAIEILHGFHPDLIVSDYHLADERADTILEFLCSEKRRIPVILLSGSADRSCSSRFESELSVHWLSKPADRHMLRNAVEALIPGTSSVFPVPAS